MTVTLLGFYSIRVTVKRRDLVLDLHLVNDPSIRRLLGHTLSNPFSSVRHRCNNIQPVSRTDLINIDRNIDIDAHKSEMLYLSVVV